MGSPVTFDGGRTWWAHFEFTRINITPTILPKKIEDFVWSTRIRVTSSSNPTAGERPALKEGYYYS
jgi:hypothetical protein